MTCRRRGRWILLVLAVGGAGAGVCWWRRRSSSSSAGPVGSSPVGAAAWPEDLAAPTSPAPAHFGAPASPDHAPAPTEYVAGAPWVPPVDGQCPHGYPVKANANSGIYHLPGGRFYARTIAERCYATSEGAEADGYRRAKA